MQHENGPPGAVFSFSRPHSCCCGDDAKPVAPCQPGSISAFGVSGYCQVSWREAFASRIRGFKDIAPEPVPAQMNRFAIISGAGQKGAVMNVKGAAAFRKPEADGARLTGAVSRAAGLQRDFVKVPAVTDCSGRTISLRRCAACQQDSDCQQGKGSCSHHLLR